VIEWLRELQIEASYKQSEGENVTEKVFPRNGKGRSGSSNGEKDMRAGMSIEKGPGIAHWDPGKGFENPKLKRKGIAKKLHKNRSS